MRTSCDYWSAAVRKVGGTALPLLLKRCHCRSAYSRRSHTERLELRVPGSGIDRHDQRTLTAAYGVQRLC